MSATTSHALAGVKILVVDDDPDALYLVRRVLADAKADVVTASTADHALRNVAIAKPDVIISDIEMPDCDGYELMKQVRHLDPSDGGATPSIALTSHQTEADKMKAKAVGFNAHVAKPMRALRLIRTVLDVIARQAPRRR